MNGCISCNLLFGRDCDLIRIVYEICTPPSERTIRDNGVFAMCHQLHIPITVLTFVPVHEKYLVLIIIKIKDMCIFPAPLDTAWITEKNKDWILYMFLDITYSPAKESIFVTITIASKHITSTCMYCNRVAAV